MATLEEEQLGVEHQAEAQQVASMAEMFEKEPQAEVEAERVEALKAGQQVGEDEVEA